MSMFDYFKDESQEFQCPNCNQTVREYWQTKDFDNALEEYRVTPEGLLQILRYKIEEIELENQIEINGYKLPGYKKTYIGWESYGFTGFIRVYTNCPECLNYWLEYHYRIVDGVVKEKVCNSRKRLNKDEN